MKPPTHPPDVTVLSPPREACLFAQYHPSGTIPPHTRRYLAHLAGCGLRLHVACSGTPHLAAGDAAFLATLGATGHPRPNAGLDFGAWSYLLRAGCALGANRILLANDSVFGPYADLRPIFARMNARPFDAWGMVESYERVWHLQSWFICLTAAALHRPALQRVFAQDFEAMNKHEVILHGELGLGVALRAEALRTGAVWRHTGRLRRLMPVNPSHFDWRSMLLAGAVPFIKTELLRENPANIAWIGGWRNAVRAVGGDPAEIDAALGTHPWRAPLTAAKPIRRLLNLLLTADRAAAATHLFA